LERKDKRFNSIFNKKYRYLPTKTSIFHMKKAYLAILALSVAFVACKKGETPSAEVQKFMSLTAGSTWDYQSTNNVTTAVTNNTMTSTNRDSTIESRVYHVFTNSNGAGNDYYNITGSDYYTFRNLGAVLPGTSNVQSIYLKDNAAKGDSWAQGINITVPGIQAPVPVNFTNTITNKDLTKTVNGTNYTNVIHVTTTISVTGLPANTIVTDIQSFYAPKVGLIESKYKLTSGALGINVDQSTILKTANIK
jgi:hypothetical protein